MFIITNVCMYIIIKRIGIWNGPTSFLTIRLPRKNYQAGWSGTCNLKNKSNQNTSFVVWVTIFWAGILVKFCIIIIKVVSFMIIKTSLFLKVVRQNWCDEIFRKILAIILGSLFMSLLKRTDFKFYPWK